MFFVVGCLTGCGSSGVGGASDAAAKSGPGAASGGTSGSGGNPGSGGDTVTLGQVVGRSTRDGGDPASEPVRIRNLIATIMHYLLDINQVRVMRGIQGDVSRDEDCKKIAAAITTPTNEWENLYISAGSPDRILLVEFKSDKLKPYTGKTLGEVAKLRGKSPEETIMRLTEGDEELQDVFEFLEELPREFCIHQQVKELSRYMGAKSEDDLDFIGEMCTVFNSMVHNREKRKEKGEVS
jgi:hypothetical protein